MALLILAYASALTFILAVVLRWMRLARMPIHLRWELYPVAHEEGAAHGGSIFERVNWWQTDKKVHHLGELKVMLPEIFVLKGVREHCRKLWRRSYPFHLGLYLLCALLALLLAVAVAEACGMASGAEASRVGRALAVLIEVVGVTGYAFLAAGALVLIVRRLSDPALRMHSAAGDFLNLVLFLAQGGLGLLAYGLADGDFLFLRGFVRALVTFSAPSALPPLVAAEIALGSVLVAYIPLTHMSHFFTKWFMYHDVRWDDDPNLVGSPIEARIRRQLQYKTDWNAPHIRGAGQKTWADVATEEVASK